MKEELMERGEAFGCFQMLDDLLAVGLQNLDKCELVNNGTAEDGVHEVAGLAECGEGTLHGSNVAFKEHKD